MILPGVTSEPLRGQYDVVIVGAGLAGLSVAYELAKAGTGRIAVLEGAYPGAGASGRNGELIRSAFSTPQWCGLLNESLRRWHELSDELDFNVLFTPRGYLVVASTEEEAARCQRNVARHKEMGVESSFVTAAEMLRIAPVLNPEYVRGGIYQASGGYAHHDAVVWAYARAAARLGVEIHAGVTVTGVVTSSGRIRGVRTSGGQVSTAVLVNAAGGNAGRIAEFAGVAASMAIFGVSKYIAVPVAAVLVWLLVVKGTYRVVEKVFLAACVFYISYIFSAFLAKPDWTTALRQTVLPTFHFNGAYLVMLIGLVGTTVAPWQFFYLQAGEVEKKIGPRQYRHARMDGLIGSITSMAGVFFIIVCTAARLDVAGRTKLSDAGQDAAGAACDPGRDAVVLPAAAAIGRPY